jgi:hypothetical protein
MTFSFRKKPLSAEEKARISEQKATIARNSFAAILAKLLPPNEQNTISWRLYQDDSTHTWEENDGTDGPNNKLRESHHALITVRNWLFKLPSAEDAGTTSINLMTTANQKLQEGSPVEGQDSNTALVTPAVITALKTLAPNISYRDGQTNVLHGSTELSWESLLGSAVMFVNNFQQHLGGCSTTVTASALDQNINIFKNGEATAFSRKARTIRGQAIEATISKITAYNSRNSAPLTPTNIAKMHSAKQTLSHDNTTNYSKAAPLYLRQEMREELLRQWSVQDARYQTLGSEKKSQTNAIKLVRENDHVGIETPLFTPLFTEIAPATGPATPGDQAPAQPVTPNKIMDTPRNPMLAAAADMLTGAGHALTSHTVVTNTIAQLLTTHQGSPLKHYQILVALRSAADIDAENGEVLNGYIDNLTDEIYLLRKATFTFVRKIANIPTFAGVEPSAEERHEAFCLLANHAETHKLPDNSSTYAALLYMLSTLESDEFDALKQSITQQSQPAIFNIFKKATLREVKEHYEQKITTEQRSRVMHDLLELYITEPKIVAPTLTSLLGLGAPTSLTQDEQDTRAITICVAFSAAMMPATLSSSHVLEEEKAQPPADHTTAQPNNTGSRAIGDDAVLVSTAAQGSLSFDDSSSSTISTGGSMLLRKAPIVALSVLLQTAIHQTGTSANPLQSLTNLAAALMQKGDATALIHFLTQLANHIPDSDHSDANKRESAFSPLIELFVHVYHLASSEALEEGASNKYRRILEMRADDTDRVAQSQTEESIGLNLYIPAADKLERRSECALQFANAAQNTMHLLIEGDTKLTWLNLVCEQLNLVHDVYLPQARILTTSFLDLKATRAGATGTPQKIKAQCEKKLAAISRISDIADQCTKQTAKRWREAHPGHKDLIKFGERALSPKDPDFIETVNYNYQASSQNLIAAEAVIISAIFSEFFPLHNPAQEIRKYLTKPLEWLEEKRASKTILSDLETMLLDLIGADGAPSQVTSIECYITLVKYFSSIPERTSYNDRNIKLNAAHLIASFIVKNPTLFDGRNNKKSVLNALQEAKVYRAATMPEIRDRAFDQLDTEDKTPLDKLSKQQLFDYIEGMTFSDTTNPRIAITTRNIFYIWCYLTRDASPEDLTKLGNIFTNFMAVTNPENSAIHPLNTLDQSTVVEKYLVGQAFVVMQQNQDHPHLSAQTRALITTFFTNITGNATTLGVTNLSANNIPDTINNIAMVLRFFLQGNRVKTATPAQNIKMLRNYMPSIDQVLTRAQLNAQPIDPEVVQATELNDSLQHLYEALHIGLCTLFGIEARDSLQDTSTRITAIFKELSPNESVGLQNMVKDYCRLTTTIKPQLREGHQKDHCKAFFIYLGRYADICKMLGQNVDSDTDALVTCLESSLASPSPEYPRASKDLANLSNILGNVLEAQAKQLIIEQTYNELRLAVAPSSTLTNDTIAAAHILKIQNALQTLENTLPHNSSSKNQITLWLKEIHAVSDVEESDELTQYYKTLIATINVNSCDLLATAAHELITPQSQLDNAGNVHRLLLDEQQGKTPHANYLIDHLLTKLESSPRSTAAELQQVVDTAQVLALVFLMVYPLNRPQPAAMPPTASSSSDIPVLGALAAPTFPGEYAQTLNQLRKALTFTCKGQAETAADSEHLIKKVLENCHWLILQTVTMSNDYKADQQDVRRYVDFLDRFYKLLPAAVSTHQRYDRVLDALSWAKAQQQEDENQIVPQTKEARFNLLPDTYPRYIAGQPLSAYQAFCLYDRKKAEGHKDTGNVIIEIYHAGYLAYLENEVKDHPVAVADILAQDKQLILRMRMITTGDRYEVALNPQQRDNHSMLNFRLSELLVSLTSELDKNTRYSQNLLPFIMRAVGCVTDKSALIHVVHFILLQQEIGNLTRQLPINEQGLTDRISKVAKSHLDTRLSTASNKSLKNADELANEAVTKLRKSYPGAFTAEGSQPANGTITKSGTYSISTVFTVASRALTPDCTALVEAKKVLKEILDRYKHGGKNGGANLNNLFATRPSNGESTAAETLSKAIRQVHAKYNHMKTQAAYTCK